MEDESDIRDKKKKIWGKGRQHRGMNTLDGETFTQAPQQLTNREKEGKRWGLGKGGTCQRKSALDQFEYRTKSESAGLRGRVTKSN